MVTAEHFTDLVKQEYLFLEQDFGFKYIDTIDTNRITDVWYKKGELLVIIRYSHANTYIEVDICTHASILESHTKYMYCIMLSTLLYHENREFNYKSIMPSQISLEESVKQTAALLKYYGADFFSGESDIMKQKEDWKILDK